MTTAAKSRTNPAKSGRQYRLAEAVLHGKARTSTMPKKVAREIIAKTPAKDRSKFAKKNGPTIYQALATKLGRTPTNAELKADVDRIKREAIVELAGKGKLKHQRKNFLGFGKSKTTFSSRLMKDAYDAGYKGSHGHRGDEEFDRWWNRQTKVKRDLHQSMRGQLKSEYWRGVNQEEQDAEKKRGDRERKPASSPVRAGGKSKDDEWIDRGLEKARRRSARQRSVSYKGKTIKEVDGSFEVLGTDWHSLKDAKEYVDIHVATGGKARLKNPNWTLKQGKAIASVYEVQTGKHAADIVTPTGKFESESFSGPKSFRAATTWARLRLHEVANPPGRKVKLFPRGKARKNPIDTATKMYEEFHGLPSTEVREYQEQEHRHSVLAGIGPLISMQVLNVQGSKTVSLMAPDPETSKLGDVVLLTVTEDGRQLMLVGGDQKIPLKALDSFGMTEADAHDHMLIGTIVQITYRTKKSFEKHGKEEIDFYHDLGKEGSKGVYPVLIYKPRNPSMEIAGGRYQIAKPEASLNGVSPGIIG